jgi:uncharacterized protein YndB with AHSA1/START domain
MPTFEQRITIDASMDTVWEVLNDTGSWSLWFPGVKGALSLPAVAPGASFSWRDGDDTGAGSIAEVDDAKGIIRAVTQDGGKTTTHTFDIDRAGGLFGLGGNDTRLLYRREYDAPGNIIGEFIAGGNPADMLAVKQTLERVKELVEARSRR